MFRDSDIKQFKSRGLDPKSAEKQIGHFKTGFPFMKLIKAATIGHGITLFKQ